MILSDSVRVLKPYAEEREGVNLCDCNSNASVSACVCECANRVGETETKHTVFFEGALEVNLVLSRSLSLTCPHAHTLSQTRAFLAHTHTIFFKTISCVGASSCI